MTTRNALEGLLIELDNFSSSQRNRADFALALIETIESLEDIPFSVIDEARDWQYKIETDGDALHTSSGTQNKALKVWIKNLITTYA